MLNLAPGVASIRHSSTPRARAANSASKAVASPSKLQDSALKPLSLPYLLMDRKRYPYFLRFLLVLSPRLAVPDPSLTSLFSGSSRQLEPSTKPTTAAAHAPPGKAAPSVQIVCTFGLKRQAVSIALSLRLAFSLSPETAAGKKISPGNLSPRGGRRHSRASLP